MDGRLGYYARWAWRATVTRRPGPLVYGIAPTDRCNLTCRGCAIPGRARPDMTFDALAALLRDARARGFRELYFTGGEPMLWRDGGRTLDDAIAEARRAGFYHVHVYTNGTLGLACGADLAWVSVDGLPETYGRRRGDHFSEVEAAIRAPGHPRTAVIYTVDRTTEGGIEPFLHWVRDTALPVTGVMFYFHTPYYGRDELYLDADERAPVIDRLLACIRDRLPVLNSRAGLLALRSGRWARRTPAAAVADVDGESVCCRASDEVCEDCGYAACTEIVEALRLRPSAVLAMARYW
ncbi:MAG: radical SAM protein [Actinobacteria bacterium]|nr:MAG: radical SAM protein [Actinomycetota bacterium]